MYYNSFEKNIQIILCQFKNWWGFCDVLIFSLHFRPSFLELWHFLLNFWHSKIIWLSKKANEINTKNQKVYFTQNIYPYWPILNCCRACLDEDPKVLGMCKTSRRDETFRVSRSRIGWGCSRESDRRTRFGPGRKCSCWCEGESRPQVDQSSIRSLKTYHPRKENNKKVLRLRPDLSQCVVMVWSSSWK